MHKGARCIVPRRRVVEIVALHSSYIIQASDGKLRNLTCVCGGGGGGGGAEPANLTSYNDIVRTRDSDIETIYYLW